MIGNGNENPSLFNKGDFNNSVRERERELIEESLFKEVWMEG